MTDFFAMGGYGGYVWSAYAIAALTLVINAVIPPRAERRTLAGIRRDNAEQNS